jgi:Lrp/AsnC family leucine-responsive transcriptional regulator
MFIKPSYWKGISRLYLQTSELLRDPRNVELLRLLRDNPRLGISELARRVGMSAPAVRERVLRLEEAGVIRGYRLDLDPAALGYPISAYVRVRPVPGQLPKIAELARSLPQVVECHRVTGEDCFVLKIYLPSIDELDHVLDQFLAYGQTTTSIIQSTPIPLRGLPLPGTSEA